MLGEAGRVLGVENDTMAACVGDIGWLAPEGVRRRPAGPQLAACHSRVRFSGVALEVLAVGVPTVVAQLESAAVRGAPLPTRTGLVSQSVTRGVTRKISKVAKCYS